MDIALDPSTRRLRPTIVFGGTPARFLRLGSAGVAALDEIETGRTCSNAGSELAERMIDAGMAHRRPGPADSTAISTVSIVIPVYGRAEQVSELVAELRRSVPSVREIVIVDDGSPDRSARQLGRLAARVAGVRLIRHQTNRGPAAARNSGVYAVDSPRVLFLDSDCRVPEATDWLESLLGHFEADGPAVAAVAPRIVAAANGRGRGVVARAAQRYDQAFCPLDMGSVPGLVGPARRVRYVPTAALLVDLGVITRAAGPDDRLFDVDLRYGEDVDFVWRLVERDGRVVYDPTVEVRHQEPASVGGLLRRRLRYGSSAAPLDRRHRGAVTHLTLSPWATLAAVGVVTGSAVAIAGSYCAQAVGLFRLLRRASLPHDQLGRAVGVSLFQGVLGIGRYLNQFWWPLVALVLIQHRVPARLRGRLLLLCLGRSIDDAFRRDASLPEKLVMVVMRTADEAAYGTGVWRGAFVDRNFGVIAPRWARWKPRAD